MTGVRMSRRRDTRDAGPGKRSCEGTTRRQHLQAKQRGPRGSRLDLAFPELRENKYVV